MIMMKYISALLDNVRRNSGWCINKQSFSVAFRWNDAYTQTDASRKSILINSEFVCAMIMNLSCNVFIKRCLLSFNEITKSLRVPEVSAMIRSGLDLQQPVLFVYLSRYFFVVSKAFFPPSEVQVSLYFYSSKIFADLTGASLKKINSMIFCVRC